VGYLLTALLIGSNMPSALYGEYRAQFGFSPVVQTLVYAVYAAALIPALLVAGPLSDALGRRPVLGAALGFGVLGAVLFACADGTAWLFGARIAQGICVGACSAAGGAALLEHEPDGDHRRASLAATATTAGGGAIGPLFAGVLAQYLPHGRTLGFLVYLAVLVPAGLALAALPDRRPDRRPGRGDGGQLTGRPAGRRRPVVRMPAVPRAVRSVFWRSALTCCAAWGVIGLFQAIVPAWITSRVSGGNLVVGAAVAALAMVCSVSAQLASAGRLSAEAAMRLGPLSLLLGMAGLWFAGRAESVPALFAVTVLAGIGHGLGYAGSMQLLSRSTTAAVPEAQGSVLSAYFVAGYIGLGLPAVLAGWLVTLQGTVPAVEEFSAIAALGALLLLVSALRSRPTPARVVAGGVPGREPAERAEACGADADGTG
jgi:MFS family permease